MSRMFSIGWLLAGGLAIAWVSVPRAAEARAARAIIEREASTAEELEDRLRCLTAARDRKTELAADLVADQLSLRAVTDEYLLLDQISQAVPPPSGGDPRWTAARSALVRARDFTRGLPAADRTAVRNRLVTAFADEFPNRPLADWP